jgi:hypothetical protein
VNVVDDVAGEVELAQALQIRQRDLRRQPRRGGVPEGERRDPVGVDMLGALLQFAIAAIVSRASS